MAKLEPKSISQAKMQRFLELEAAAQEYMQLKEEITEMLHSGLTAQPGPLSCRLKKSDGQRRPKWKEEGQALAVKNGLDGEQWAQEIIDRTPRGSPSYTLEIIDRNNPVG